VPESKRHLELRTALYQMVKLELKGTAAVGSDQFVYWNARDPGRRLAPDLFVRLGQQDSEFDSWRIWERGAPDLAVAIVSESDASEASWADKLERYQESGLGEIVRFDPAASPGQRLRVWDRVQGDLVERIVERDAAPCVALGLHWVVRERGEHGAMLRLSRDATGSELLPTPEEREAEQARLRETEARLRRAAEARVAELEAEIAKLRGGGW
jgi:Uma2 family endonuclease